MLILAIAIGLCLSAYRRLSGISMPFWSGKNHYTYNPVELEAYVFHGQQLYMDCRRSTMYHLWLTWGRALCSRGKSVLRGPSAVLICVLKDSQ